MDKHAVNATKDTGIVLGIIALAVLVIWGLLSLIQWTIDTHHELYIICGMGTLVGVLIISLIWCKFYEESVKRG